MSLQNKCLEIADVDELCAERYHKALALAREDKEEDLTLDEIKKLSVKSTKLSIKNSSVSEELCVCIGVCMCVCVHVRVCA